MNQDLINDLQKQKASIFLNWKFRFVLKDFNKMTNFRSDWHILKKNFSNIRWNILHMYIF